MKTYPVVLSIAGSDSGGGAGIQADIKTISALGAFATTAITAVTVQNTCGVEAIEPVSADIVAGQIEAVLKDLPVRAVKIGMIHSPELVDVIAEQLQKYQPEFVVLDPVMVATSKDKLIKDETIEKMVKQLFPLADLITPNLDEASCLCKKKVVTEDDMIFAARQLLQMSPKAVLIKGGHLNDKQITDVFMANEDKKPYLFPSEKIESCNLHGTGCTLSSAIATHLALGFDMLEAIKLSEQYIYSAIDNGKNVRIGHGNGAVNHAFAPQKLKKINL